MERYRAFWSAVVLQANHDIEREPIGSTNYEAAVAFFTAPGDWAESRGAIADCIDVHPDDLRRTAVRLIRARRLAERLPAVAPPIPRPIPPPPRIRVTPAKPPKPPKLPHAQRSVSPIPVAAIPVAPPPVAPMRRARNQGNKVSWAFNRTTGRWQHAAAPSPPR